MNAKEATEVKTLGYDHYGLKLVNALIDLREMIYAAGEAYEKNDEIIDELHLLRTDIEHEIAYREEVDPVTDALIGQKLAGKYRDVQKRRMELITENQALEYIACNQEFVDEISDILEKMTGRLQFVEHASYKPKSKLTYLIK